MTPRMLLAAIVSLSVVPCAMAQIRVNSVGVGHFTVTRPAGQLLPYVRSTTNSWNGPVTKGYTGTVRSFHGGVHSGNAGSPQWGGYAAATGASGAGH